MSPLISLDLLKAPRLPFLDRASILQHLRQLALLALQLRVAANVLVVDEYVRDRALAGDLLERILDGGAVVDLVELDLREGQTVKRTSFEERGSPQHSRCTASRPSRSTETSWLCSRGSMLRRHQ